MTPTPVRHIRIPDEVWTPALETANDLGDGLPDVVRLALTAYATDPAATLAALVKIRGART